MKFDGTDLYAALVHELKNDLGLLSMTIDSIPMQNEAMHDSTVDAARLQCQGVVDRLQQALLIYKSISQPIHPDIDAWSPHDMLNEIRDRAVALSRGRIQVEAVRAPDLPQIWFFDRDLVEMALINAIHNSLAYGRTRLRIEAGMQEGFLALKLHDDSPGYPDHILNGDAADAPRHGKGTGLGLQFCRIIAQSHDNQGRRGELRLHNDQGAVFCLLLP
jgi:K+-sensing histidine kinase KdpD